MQCKAITKSGTQCSKNAREGSDYCATHAKLETSVPAKAAPKAKPAPKATQPAPDHVKVEAPKQTSLLQKIIEKIKQLINRA